MPCHVTLSLRFATMILLFRYFAIDWYAAFTPPGSPAALLDFLAALYFAFAVHADFAYAQRHAICHAAFITGLLICRFDDTRMLFSRPPWALYWFSLRCRCHDTDAAITLDYAATPRCHSYYADAAIFADIFMRHTPLILLSYDAVDDYADAAAFIDDISIIFFHFFMLFSWFFRRLRLPVSSADTPAWLSILLPPSSRFRHACWLRFIYADAIYAATATTPCRHAAMPPPRRHATLLTPCLFMRYHDAAERACHARYARYWCCYAIGAAMRDAAHVDVHFAAIISLSFVYFIFSCAIIFRHMMPSLYFMMPLFRLFATRQPFAGFDRADDTFFSVFSSHIFIFLYCHADFRHWFSFRFADYLIDDLRFSGWLSFVLLTIAFIYGWYLHWCWLFAYFHADFYLLPPPFRCCRCLFIYIAITPLLLSFHGHWLLYWYFDWYTPLLILIAADSDYLFDFHYFLSSIFIFAIIFAIYWYFIIFFAIWGIFIISLIDYHDWFSHLRLLFFWCVRMTFISIIIFTLLSYYFHYYWYYIGFLLMPLRYADALFTPLPLIILRHISIIYVLMPPELIFDWLPPFYFGCCRHYCLLLCRHLLILLLDYAFIFFRCIAIYWFHFHFHYDFVICHFLHYLSPSFLSFADF